MRIWMNEKTTQTSKLDGNSPETVEECSSQLPHTHTLAHTHTANTDQRSDIFSSRNFMDYAIEKQYIGKCTPAMPKGRSIVNPQQPPLPPPPPLILFIEKQLISVFE